MIKDTILAWLNNTGTISKELRAHLDKNLNDFGSMFYPQAAFRHKYPPSELEYQIAKGFILFFIETAKESENIINNDPSTTWENKSFKIAKNFAETLHTKAQINHIQTTALILMSCWCSELLTGNQNVFEELIALPKDLKSAVFYTPLQFIKNVKNTSQLKKLQEQAYLNILNRSEENNMLDLLDTYKEDIEINHMLSLYNPNIKPRDLQTSETFIKIHDLLISAITSTDEIYILDSDRVQQLLLTIPEYEMLIPEGVKKQWDIAKLLYDFPTDRKNILRMHNLNKYDELNNSDITFI